MTSNFVEWRRPETPTNARRGGIYPSDNFRALEREYCPWRPSFARIRALLPAVRPPGRSAAWGKQLGFCGALRAGCLRVLGGARGVPRVPGGCPWVPMGAGPRVVGEMQSLPGLLGIL